MARKERNSVDYFPHSVTHGKKMFYLRDKFKNDGYAVWFMLLEELGKAEYHYLDLKDEIQLMYLSSEFKVTELMLKEIIEVLVKFDEFDSELWINECILFNEKFNENISDAYKKRSNECINKDSLLSILISKGRSLSPKSIRKQSKGKGKGDGKPQSKVKETKEDKIKEKLRCFEWLNLEYEIPLIRWLVYKSDRAENYKNDDSLKILHDKLIKLSKNDKDVAREIIEQSMGNNWAGLFELKESSKKELPFNQDIKSMNYSQNPKEV